jgi:hypothetical protein
VRQTHAWGTAAPYRLVALPKDGRWAVICQARSDTDHDGAVRVTYSIHGDEGGDDMSAFIVDARGHESRIDNLLAASDRWLAVVERGAPVLIDTGAVPWKRERLRRSLPSFSITRGVRNWSFDPTGHWLLYFRDEKPIVRELSTGKEREIPSAAWRASWSADGAWVILERLHGDTDGDGFVHGPDFSPREGIRENCGRRVEWSSSFDDLDPGWIDHDASMQQRLVDTIDRADDLEHVLWRVSDALVVSAEAPIDHDTIVTRSGDGVLHVGAVGSEGAELAPASCRVDGVSARWKSVLVVCPIDDGHALVRWAREGAPAATRELAKIADASPVIEVGPRFAGIYPKQIVADLEDGSIITAGDHIYYLWSDHEHVLYESTPDARHAVLRWADGRTLALERGEDLVFDVAGQDLLFGSSLVDLETGQVAHVSDRAIDVRSDGAVLIDGGPQRLPDGEHGPHRGPLRWVRPRR